MLLTTLSAFDPIRGGAGGDTRAFFLRQSSFTLPRPPADGFGGDDDDEDDATLTQLGSARKIFQRTISMYINKDP